MQNIMLHTFFLLTLHTALKQHKFLLKLSTTNKAYCIFRPNFVVAIIVLLMFILFS